MPVENSALTFIGWNECVKFQNQPALTFIGWNECVKFQNQLKRLYE